jgi:hypothetical protein
LVKAQLPQAGPPSATTTTPSAASSSKKSAKKAAKSAKKQAKQQQPNPASGSGAAVPGSLELFQGRALAWAGMVLGFALSALAGVQEVLSAAVLDGWQLLDWLEVCTCFCNLLLERVTVPSSLGYISHGGFTSDSPVID